MCLTRMQEQLGLSSISVVPADIGVTMETNLLKFSDDGVSNGHNTGIDDNTSIGDNTFMGENKVFLASVATTFASCSSSSSETNQLPKQCRYQCKFCQKSFTRPSHLTRHTRIHTGEKPFKCLLCGKGFRQSNHLTSHMKTHEAVKHAIGATTSLNSAEVKQAIGLKNRLDPTSGTLTPSGQTLAAVSKNPLTSQPFSIYSSASTSSLTSSLTTTAVGSQLQRQLAMPPLSINQPQNIDNPDDVMLRPTSGSLFSSVVTEKRQRGRLLSSNPLLRQMGLAQPQNWQKHPNQLANGRQEYNKKNASNNSLSTTKQLLRCELCNKQFMDSTFLDIHMQMHSAIRFKTKLRLKADNASGNVSNALPVSSANSRVAATAAPARLNMKENVCLNANTIRGLLNKPSPLLSNLQTCLDKDISSPSKEVTIKPDPDVVVIEEVSSHQPKVITNLEAALKKDSSLQSSGSDSMTHVSKQVRHVSNKPSYSQNVRQISEPSTFGKKVPHLLPSGEKFLSSESQNESRRDQARVPYSTLGTLGAKASEPNLLQPSLHNLTIKEQLSRCTFCNKDFANSVILAQHVRSHLKEISAGPRYQLPTQAATNLSVDSADGTSVSRSALASREKEGHLRLAASRVLLPQRESLFPKKLTSGSDSFIGKRRNRSEASFVRKPSANYRHSASYFTSAGQVRNISKPFSLQARHFRKLNSLSGSMLNNQQWNQNQGLLTKGQKRFKCRHCVKAFSRPSHLLRHVRIHTGEKPFKCKYCDKRFRQSNHLTSHIKTHSAGRPANCRYCNKTLPSFTHLNQHIKISHLGRPLALMDDLQAPSPTLALVDDLQATNFVYNSTEHHQPGTNIQAMDDKLNNASILTSSNHSSSCAPVPTPFSCLPTSPQSQILFKDDWPMSSASPPVAATLQSLPDVSFTENRPPEVHVDNLKVSLPIFKDCIDASVGDTNSLPLNKTIKEEPLSDPETLEQFLISAAEPTATNSPHTNSNNRILQENKRFSPKSQDASLSVGQFHNAQPLSTCPEEMLDTNTQGHASTFKAHADSSQLGDDPSLADMSLESASACNKKEDTTVVFTSQTSDCTDGTAVYLIKKSLNQDKYSTYLVSLNESGAPFTKKEPADEEKQEVYLVRTTNDSPSEDLTRSTQGCQIGLQRQIIHCSTSSEHSDEVQNSTMNECLNDPVLPITHRVSGLSANPQLQGERIILKAKDEKRFVRELQDDQLLLNGEQQFLEQFFECKKCNHKFSDSFALSRHLEVHSKQESDENFNAKSSREITPHVTLECPICDQRFSDSLNLEIHVKSHTGLPTSAPTQTSTNDFVVERSTDANTVPAANFARNACGISKNYLTLQKRSLKQNLATEKQETRKGLKPYRFFHRPQLFKKSLAGSTLNRSTFSAVAALTKANVSTLPAKQNRISYRTMANGRQCFKCTFCEKSFSRPSHLIRHVRIHTGEKPFKCTLCTKSFTQSNHLTSHLKTHMEKVGSFVCQYCQKVFLLPNVFVAHLQTHEVPASFNPVPKRIASDKENLANPCSSSSLLTKPPANTTMSSDGVTTLTTNTTALPSATSQSSTIRKLLSLASPMLQPSAAQQRDPGDTDHIITLGPQTLTSVHYQSNRDVSKTSLTGSAVNANKAGDFTPENPDRRRVFERDPVKSEQDYLRGLSEISEINYPIALSPVGSNQIQITESDSGNTIHNFDRSDINFHERISEISASQDLAGNMDVKPNVTTSVSVMPPAEAKSACGTVSPKCGTSSVGASIESAPNCTEQRRVTVSAATKTFSLECCNSEFSSIEEFQQHVMSHVNHRAAETNSGNGVQIKTEILL